MRWRDPSVCLKFSSSLRIEASNISIEQVAIFRAIFLSFRPPCPRNPRRNCFQSRSNQYLSSNHHELCTTSHCDTISTQQHRYPIVMNCQSEIHSGTTTHSLPHRERSGFHGQCSSSPSKKQFFAPVQIYTLEIFVLHDRNGYEREECITTGIPAHPFFEG